MRIGPIKGVLRMKKVLISILVFMLVFAMIGVFVACDKAEEDSAEYAAEQRSTVGNAGGGVQKVILTTDRMMVYTVDLSLSVENYSAATAAIRAELAEAGGYEESSYTSNSGLYRFTLRVPTVKLNAFLEKVGKAGTVEEQTVSGRDITDQYVSAEQERDALIAKKAAFEVLAAQATTFDEQLKIQDKIIEVAAEIDRYNDTLSSYRKSSDYSTVEVTLYEEGTYEEPDFWQKLGEIFFGSTKSIGTVFGVILTVIIAVLPYALLLGVLFGIYALIRLIVCRVKKQPFTLFRPKEKKSVGAKTGRETVRPVLEKASEEDKTSKQDK